MKGTDVCVNQGDLVLIKGALHVVTTLREIDWHGLAAFCHTARKGG